MPTASTICHIEIPSTDLPGSKSFYEDVFGWTVEIIEDGGYGLWMVPKDDGEGYAASGGFEPGIEPVSETKGVVLYLECADVTAQLARISAAGGEVVKEKTQISPEHGYLGLFRDPSRNLLGVWSRA